MPPRDNWYPNLTDQPGWYWAYVEFLHSNVYDMGEVFEEADVDTNQYGTDGWDGEEEDSDDESVMYVGSGTRDDPIDLTC